MDSLCPGRWKETEKREYEQKPEEAEEEVGRLAVVLLEKAMGR